MKEQMDKAAILDRIMAIIKTNCVNVFDSGSAAAATKRDLEAFDRISELLVDSGLL